VRIIDHHQRDLSARQVADLASLAMKPSIENTRPVAMRRVRARLRLFEALLELRMSLLA